MSAANARTIALLYALHRFVKHLDGLDFSADLECDTKKSEARDALRESVTEKTWAYFQQRKLELLIDSNTATEHCSRYDRALSDSQDT